MTVSRVLKMTIMGVVQDTAGPLKSHCLAYIGFSNLIDQQLRDRISVIHGF